MSTVKVSVKWGKKKFDNIELNLSEPPAVFKMQLYSISGVTPERQKIMIKGGTLKDDQDWAPLGIKDGHTFMLMGSAENDIPKGPVDRPVFAEDLPEDMAIDAMSPSGGLHNLGNTCYMNSTLQCFRAVPELGLALKKYSAKAGQDTASNITSSLRDLFGTLNNSNQAIPPLEFLQHLRTAFPQFAQKANGVYMQQDAEECWTQILLSLSQKLPPIGDNTTENKSFTLSNSAIGQLFSGELLSTITNSESSDEPKQIKTDAFQKLACHITATTNFLVEGIRSGLEEPITKKSELLGREAQYIKSSRISKLPFYVTVQFVRFFWKQDTQVKAKIARPVEFPFTLDLYDFCTDDLKQQLQPKRKLYQEQEDKRILDQAVAAKENKGKSGKQEVDTKKQTQAISTDPSTWVNETGFYELFAVLTHKGRMADSGHYVSWVKEDEDRWLKYDDETVSIVNNEEIKKLSGKGGSDWHIAYLCLYRTKKLEPAQEHKV